MNTASCIAMLGLLVGCTGQQGPGPLASDSLAVSLFVDLHLANARQELELGSRGRDAILRDYGLDSATFAQVMDYYAHHPEEYAALYAQVTSRLSEDEMRSVRR